MNLFLNTSVFVHRFSDELIINHNGNDYLLNKYQSKIIELINNNPEIEFHRITDELLNSFVIDMSRQKLLIIVEKMISMLIQNGILYRAEKGPRIKFSGKRGYYYPIKLVIELTNRCGLACEHCFKECNSLKHDKLETEELIKFLNSIKDYIPVIQLTGGEPMLHPDFSTIANYITKNFIETSITTTASTINSKNVHYLRDFDSVQVSLYSNESDNHDKITSTKGSFNRTLHGIRLLREADCNVIVSNISRIEFLNDSIFDSYIQFLIKNNIKEVTFGQLSILGRANSVGNSWKLSKHEYENFAHILDKFQQKYKHDIKINNWNESDNKRLLKGIADSGLKCGAALTEWTISENGLLKPCSFFPDSYFNQFNYKEFETVIQNRQSNYVKEGIKTWENELNSIGLSTNKICEVIYDAFKK